MNKKEAILPTFALVLALLSVLVSSLNMGLEKNVFMLAFLTVGLLLAILFQTYRGEEIIELTQILGNKKITSIFAVIIIISLALLILPESIKSGLINSGPQYIKNGIVIGSILSLGAIGLTTVYKILGFPNFAHGDFLTFGAYIVFFGLSLNLPIILSVIFAVAASIALVTILEKSLWKPLREKGAGNITMLIASIGLALFLRNLIRFLFGTETHTYPFPVIKATEFFGISITIDEIIILVFSMALMSLVYLLLKRTEIGKAMRALSDNKSLAKVSGINVNRVILFTWIIGISLAVIAGFFYGIYTVVNPRMGWSLLIPLFASVIVGGIGNPYGAMLGGMIVGISQEFSIIFIPAEYKPAVSFVLIIILLLWKPEGLMGG